VFKLSKYLLSFTGDAQYGDWIERLVLNGLEASIPMTADGHVFYYSDYCLYGGSKRNTDFGWSCCTGTRPQAVADCADLIYFHDAQNLYVNLFTASRVHWRLPGGASVNLVQNTSFPQSGDVQISLTLDKPARFGIQFRVPGWVAAAPSASVNGREVQLKTDAKHWAFLRQTWRDGDQIRLHLPMQLWTSSFDPPKPTPAATLFGPVVLAFEAPNPKSLRELQTASLTKLLVPTDGQPLHFKLATDVAVRARPFYELHEGQPYLIYLDPKTGMRISHREMTFTGQWYDAGAFRFSNEIGAAAACEFEGSGIRWLGKRFDDGGKAEITIDGKVVGVVDQYGPGRDLPFDWRHSGLLPGRHSIRLKLLPEIPENSKNRYLNVIGFEVLTEP